MRLRFGRPDLRKHSHRFTVPDGDDGLAVTFLGVSSLLFDDGDFAVLFDGYFSRPPMVKVAFGRIAPDEQRIDAALERLGFGADGRKLDAVVPVHSHFDHVLDSAAVVERAGGVLVGGESTANVGRGAGLDPNRLHLVRPGVPKSFGAFTLTHVVSQHCPPDRFPGRIRGPVVPPVRAREYKCGEAWSVLLSHGGGRTALIQGSAGFVPAALDGHAADVAYLGIGQLGIQTHEYIRDYWTHTVRAVGASRVILTHWDDFFRPLDEPLRALPYAGDDLDVTLSTLDDLANADGRLLAMPTVWRRQNPWA